MPLKIIAVTVLSFVLSGCVTGEPFLTKDTRLKNGKEYRLEVGGEFTKPEGKGPFPTVMILQSCGGTSAALYDWADKFKSWGYASFLVKSLEARGMQTCQHPFSRVMMNMDVASDALGALDYLSKRADVDAKRIAVVGFSLGAGAMNDYILSRPNPPSATDFVGAISFYQKCDAPMRALSRYPVLQLVASLDHVHAPSCTNYKETWGRFTESEPSVAKNLDRLTVVVYKGVHHSFDDTKHYSPRADIGGNTMQYDRDAHRAAVVEVKNFLAKVFKR
jgi:dienelactone hydrolase